MITTRLLVLFVVMLFLSGSFKPAYREVQKTFSVEADPLSYQLTEVMDASNRVMYYYTNIDRFPCEDSVCYRMKLRMYWDVCGNFLKIAYHQGNELTKINHVPFTSRDYKRLHQLLNNPNAFIQYYKLDDLTDHQSEMTYYSVDAVTSATVSDVNIVYESVKGAVKTCYTLWKIANDTIPNMIKQQYAGLHNEVSEPFQSCLRLITMNKESELLKEIHDLPVPSAANFGDYTKLLDTLKSDKDLNKKLLDELCLKLNAENEHTIILYNFLLQQNFRAKSVRKYKPIFEENN